MASKKRLQISNLLVLYCFLSIGAPTKVANAFKFSEKTCREYNLGSNWYCEKEEGKPEALPTADEVMKRQDVPPEEKAALLNQLWETQQKRAVITGKKEDLENVLVTQRYIAKLGTDFAKKMMRLIETNPEYFQKDNYFANISKEYIEDHQRTEVLSQARQRYAIAFVYASNCPYCQRQLPILQSMRESYGMSLLGISADGGVYNGLDQNITDLNVTNDPNIKAFPTIMLLDARNNKRIFIAKGLTTKDNLEKLIYRAIAENKEVENAKTN